MNENYIRKFYDVITVNVQFFVPFYSLFTLHEVIT